MTLTHNELRRLIQDTRYRQHGSIATAAWFLKDIARAVGKQEAAQWFGFSTWKKAFSQASRTLVLNNPQTEFDLEAKAAKDGVDNSLPDGCIAEVTSRVTTVDKDWDGDIVHPDGLIFDPRGAFLWMHSQAQPIGRIDKVLTQNEQEARCKFLVADVPLGRDAVKLMKIGALRKSIGFKVLEATPLGFVAGQNGKEVPTGFDIKRAAVLETSAVAIPANPNTEIETVLAKEYDAVRSMGTKGFESHLMQKWAGHLFENRPTRVFKGASLDSGEAKEFTDAIAAQVAETVIKEVKQQMTTKQNELETKEADESDLWTKYLAAGMDDYAEGSFESCQNGVQKSCKKYLCDKGQCSDGHYPSLMATYGDKALVAMRKYDYDSGEYERKCYELGYSMDGNKCTITSHKAVKVTPQVMEVAEKRFAEGLRSKSVDFAAKGCCDGKTTGDAETDLLDEACCGGEGGMKKKETTVQSESEQLKALLVKTLMGDIESSAELRAMIRDVASYLEKAGQLDDLLGLVGAGA